MTPSIEKLVSDLEEMEKRAAPIPVERNITEIHGADWDFLVPLRNAAPLLFAEIRRLWERERALVKFLNQAFNRATDGEFELEGGVYGYSVAIRAVLDWLDSTEKEGK